MVNPIRPGLSKAQITADVVIFTVEDNQLKVLLIQRAEDPFRDQWALPGGFLWEGESTAQTAARVLADKAGVSADYLEQLYTFDDPKRDPRGPIVSVVYFALVPSERLNAGLPGGTQRPSLFAVSELPKLAFDHAVVMRYAIGRLRAKLEYTNVAFALLPSSFTFNQLQSLYEIIMGAAVDRRNFRKKFMSLGLIKSTGERLEGARHRPAELFTFVSRHPTELDRWL